MYAEIHAVTEEKEDSSGKNSWVNTGNYVLAVGELPAQHLGDPDKYLEVTAESSQRIGTGERGGEDRTILRKLTLHLLEDDLNEIFRFALKNNLAGADLKSQIRVAHKELTELAQAMKVRITRRPTRTRRKRRAG